jgi:hypothetical protein
MYYLGLLFVCAPSDAEILLMPTIIRLLYPRGDAHRPGSERSGILTAPQFGHAGQFKAERPPEKLQVIPEFLRFLC